MSIASRKKVSNICWSKPVKQTEEMYEGHWTLLTKSSHLELSGG